MDWITVSCAELKSKRHLFFLFSFYDGYHLTPAEHTTQHLDGNSFMLRLLLIKSKPSSSLRVIWMLWLFQHSRLHLYFPDIGPTAAYFPGEFKSNSMCELVVTSLWKTDIPTRRRKRLDSFLARLPSIQTNVHCECGAVVMYYSNMFVLCWIHLLSGKQPTACIYSHCTHTSHTHLFPEVF